MEDSENYHSLIVAEEEHLLGEAFHQSAADTVVYHRKLPRIACSRQQGSLDG